MSSTTSSESGLSTPPLEGAVAAAPGPSGGEVLEKFYHKNKCDLMYELRRLQMGEKPVTGTGHRDNLNHFFDKRFQAAAKRDANEHAPSNTDNVEQHRPESVVVEVTTLVERRPVSSLLQSATFRRQLDRVVRSTLGSLQATQPTPVRQNARNIPVPAPRPPPPPPPAVAPPAPPTVAPLVTAPEEPIPESEPSVYSSSSSEPQARAAPNIVQDPSPVQRVIPWLTQQVETPLQPQPERTANQPLSWNTINEGMRDQIVEEISELVHQQLVTSTLEGGFRNTLENMMYYRQLESGANGERVMSYIQNIPRTEHIARNDFSHLGIQTPADDAADSVSIISTTAQAVPYSQSNHALRRELKEMKSQMTELKNMMKLTFELQMDVQRSIRQEVAAAISGALGGATATPPLPTSPVNDCQCLICLDKAADTVLYKCGHLCLCVTCGMELKNRGGNCPVCRAPIRDLVRVYKCHPN